MAPIPKHRISLPGPARRPPAGEKAGRYHDDIGSLQTPAPPRRTMKPIRNILLALCLCFLVTLGLATAVTPQQWHRVGVPHREDVVPEQKHAVNYEPSSFSALLRSASPEALHELLHKYFPGTFQHGVWPSEKSALTAVHRENAPLATSIAQLAKRQDNGNTTSSPSQESTTSTTSSEVQTSTTTTTSTPPPTTSTTTTPTAPATESTSTTQATQSTTTSSSSAPNTSTTTQSSSKSSSSGTTMTTSKSGSSSNSGSVTKSASTSTSSESMTPVVTTFTSTDSGGAVVVVTRTSYVKANPAPSGTRAAGSLQTNAAPALRGGSEVIVGVVIGAAIGGAALLA